MNSTDKGVIVRKHTPETTRSLNQWIILRNAWFFEDSSRSMPDRLARWTCVVRSCLYVHNEFIVDVKFSFFRKYF